MSIFSGWGDSHAHRYPMGKGAKPEYSWWNGEKLGYIEARKKIYVPLYYNAVKDTEAYAKLKELYHTEDIVYLWDFDGFDNKKRGMSLKDVINDPSRPMGHAFILKKMLEGDRLFCRNERLFRSCSSAGQKHPGS